MSFFSLYRIILLAKKIEKSTFESLETPIADMSSVYDRVTTMKKNMVSILERYTPWFTKRPLNQGIVWEPTWKTVLTMSQANEALIKGDSRTLWHPVERTLFISIVSRVGCSRCPHTSSCWSLSTHRVFIGLLASCGQKEFFARDSNNKLFSGLYF